MIEIPTLKKDDYLKQDKTFWKNFRNEITKALKEPGVKLPKNAKNIYKLSQKIGIKPTARYFNIEPSQVRYYIKKYKNEK